MNSLNRELFINKKINEFFLNFPLMHKIYIHFSMEGLGVKKLVIYNGNCEL